MRTILTILFSAGAFAAIAQRPFAHEGAIHKDSNAFVNWAVQGTITRGYQDISNTSLGYTTVGDGSNATGKAGENGVVSLGDGGSAVLLFQKAVMNGPGYDFAVFENGFPVAGDTSFFLELAFVEVSSDGQRYVRFPAVSETGTTVQKGNGDGMDPRKLTNLAGNYVLFYGTPFDLEQLKDSAGLDVNRITHIRLVDVVGSLNTQYGTKDSRGVMINDPWPTPFGSSGFDLDAVGVIHQDETTGVHEVPKDGGIYSHTFYRSGEDVRLTNLEGFSVIKCTDVSGKEICMQPVRGQELTISSGLFREGVYFITLSEEKRTCTFKIMVQ